MQAVDSRPLPQTAGFFSGQMSGVEPAMPSFQQPASGMLMDAQPQAQQRQQQRQQQQQSSHDQRMRIADGAGGSGDTSDSDSCRSGDSDGEDDGLASLRSTSMQTDQNGRHNSGGRQETSPMRPGLWATSQQFAVKQEAGTDRSGSRGGHNNRTKKPHLKVGRSCWRSAAWLRPQQHRSAHACAFMLTNTCSTCHQGRFSGRLETKHDEKLLADECRLLGPMLGGTGKRGEKSRLTLAKIVRGIAAGDVRHFCEARENMLRVCSQTLWQQSGK